MCVICKIIVYILLLSFLSLDIDGIFLCRSFLANLDIYNSQNDLQFFLKQYHCYCIQHSLGPAHVTLHYFVQVHPWFSKIIEFIISSILTFPELGHFYKAILIMTGHTIPDIRGWQGTFTFGHFEEPLFSSKWQEVKVATYRPQGNCLDCYTFRHYILIGRDMIQSLLSGSTNG